MQNGHPETTENEQRAKHRNGVISGMFGFVAAVILARIEGWKAADFAWSMWISTLTLGSSLLVLISLAVLIVPSFLKKDRAPVRDRLFVATVFGGFLLGIFVGFHYVHGELLKSVLPPAFAVEKDLFRCKSPAVFLLLFSMCLRTYWKFIVLSAVLWIADMVAATRNKDRKAVFGPFASMVKMHITIILLCVTDIIGLGGHALYVLLLVFYFPFGVFRKTSARKEKV